MYELDWWVVNKDGPQSFIRRSCNQVYFYYYVTTHNSSRLVESRETNSTSNTSAEFGGITDPNPLFPDERQFCIIVRGEI